MQLSSPVKDSLEIWNYDFRLQWTWFSWPIPIPDLRRRQSFSPPTTVSQSLVAVKDLQRPACWLNFWMTVFNATWESWSMLKPYDTYVVLPLHQATQQMSEKNHRISSIRSQVEAAFRAHGDARNLYASEAAGFHEARFSTAHWGGIDHLPFALSHALNKCLFGSWTFKQELWNWTPKSVELFLMIPHSHHSCLVQFLHCASRGRNFWSVPWTVMQASLEGPLK